MSKYRIYTEQQDYGRRTKLAILVEDANGTLAVAAPLKFTRVDPSVLDATMTLEATASTANLDGRALLQAMLDHAWELGLRPGGVPEADTTKQVAALHRHLEDMRALVFEKPAPVGVLHTLERSRGET